MVDLALMIQEDRSFYGNWEMFMHEILEFDEELDEISSDEAHDHEHESQNEYRQDDIEFNEEKI